MSALIRLVLSCLFELVELSLDLKRYSSSSSYEVELVLPECNSCYDGSRHACEREKIKSYITADILGPPLIMFP